METTARSAVPSQPEDPRWPEGRLTMASTSAHEAVDSLAGFAGEAALKAKPKIDGVADLAHQAVDKVADAAAPTAQWLAEQGDSLSAAQEKLLRDTRTYITANPLTSVAIALVAGLVISRVVR